jgi:hypothetical protein
MKPSQSERLNRLRIHASENNGRLFRNNVGEAWAGKSKWVLTNIGKLFTLLSPSRIKFGLTEGSSDLIGWKTIEITPDLIGRKIAVFWAVEEKTGRDTLSEEQANFLNQVSSSGGIAELAISENGKTKLKNINGSEGEFLW